MNTEQEFAKYATLAFGGILLGEVLRETWKAAAYNRTTKHSLYHNLQEMISDTPPVGKRVAIIGSGISGIQAMKSCLAEGIDVVCFEADRDMGGFWRFKENVEEKSVYKSTHIDTDRDLNSFGDNPMLPSQPLLISNQELFRYLQTNCDKFQLWEKIRFNTRVNFVTVKNKNATENHQWIVKWTSTDPLTHEKLEGEDIFDGVLVCTGRHGHGGWIPPFPGLNKFSKPYIHSSQYKYPEKHHLKGKTVLVVGVGNSGIDIVTEVAQAAEKTILLARSGSWIFKVPHGEETFSRDILDRFTANIIGKLPWWVASGLVEKTRLKKSQEVLNKHGLEPKHRLFQQHLLVTGLTDPDHTLHDELEKGTISVKKHIREFSETGVFFEDDSEPTEVDFVIFATGYKQGVSFVDPEIVDMRYERQGNDVPLYKYIFPIHENDYSSLGFINFLQSATFMCAELQTRYYAQVLKGTRRLPSFEEQQKELLAVRQTLCAQYMDRQQLRVQAGLSMKYYDDLARHIGCYPSLSLLMKERPTAIWHAWLTPWQPLQYRLVGAGRLELAEQEIEELYYSRFYGVCPRTGKKRTGPKNRSGITGFFKSIGVGAFLGTLVVWHWLKGANLGDNLEDKLEENLKYAEYDKVPHALEFNAESQDVATLKQLSNS